MPKPPHFIWSAFLALSQERRMTEQQAIDTLLEIWPSHPVEALLKAEGDERKALALLHGTTQGSASGQDAAEPDPQDMNTLMRTKARRGTLSGPENGQQAAADNGQQAAGRDDDFIRQRYTERYRSQGQG